MHLAHFRRGQKPVSFLFHEFDSLTFVFATTRGFHFCAVLIVWVWQRAFIDLDEAASHMILPLHKMSLGHGNLPS